MEWEWYKKPNMVQFFIHCLLKATHKELSYKGIILKQGEFISGRKVLSDETGLTEQQIRTCIKYLKSTNELTTTPTKGIDGKYTVFRLISWKKYQDKLESTSTPTTTATEEQPSLNQGLTTYKNVKNEKNEKECIYFRNENYVLTLIQFETILETYRTTQGIIDDTIDAILNYKKIYKDLNLTLQKWIRNTDSYKAEYESTKRILEEGVKRKSFDSLKKIIQNDKFINHVARLEGLKCN